ncbi:MAG: hypothetical protein LKE92_04255 [Atopobiaceae bacterium]|nr:hypothetical protein [Atopobiaceae bacterium]
MAAKTERSKKEQTLYLVEKTAPDYAYRNTEACLYFSRRVAGAADCGGPIMPRRYAEDVRGMFSDRDGKPCHWNDALTPLYIRCILKDRPEWRKLVRLKPSCRFEGIELPSFRDVLPPEARRAYERIIGR